MFTRFCLCGLFEIKISIYAYICDFPPVTLRPINAFMQACAFTWLVAIKKSFYQLSTDKSSSLYS